MIKDGGSQQETEEWGSTAEYVKENMKEDEVAVAVGEPRADGVGNECRSVFAMLNSCMS